MVKRTHDLGRLGHITPSPAGPSLGGNIGIHHVQLFLPNTCTQL